MTRIPSLNQWFVCRAVSSGIANWPGARIEMTKASPIRLKARPATPLIQPVPKARNGAGASNSLRSFCRASWRLIGVPSS